MYTFIFACFPFFIVIDWALIDNTMLSCLLQDILRFWLGKGVDGFNIVGAEYLTEDPSFNDEPSSGTGSAGVS